MTTDTTTESTANVPISLLGPVGLKDAIERTAKEQGVTRMEFIRSALADATGYVLPPVQERTRRRKYASAEEREAAAKTRAKDRRDLINKLLAANEAAKASGAPIVSDN